MIIEHAVYPVEGLEIRRGGGGGRSRGGGGRAGRYGGGGGGGRGSGGGRSWTGGRSIFGRFGLSPGSFRRMATVNNRGKRRKEMIMKKAFSWSIKEVARLKTDLDRLLQSKASIQAIEDATQELAKRDIHILYGHSFDKTLGSVVGGGVIIEEIFDDEEDPYLSFEAELPENENAWPGHVIDTVRQIEMGLIGGISPGFMVPPKDVVPNAEEFLPEPGNPEVLVRQINEAVLVELSLVTRPSYTETDVTVRAEDAEVDYLREGFRLWL